MDKGAYDICCKVSTSMGGPQIYRAFLEPLPGSFQSASIVAKYQMESQLACVGKCTMLGMLHGEHGGLRERKMLL